MILNHLAGDFDLKSLM